DAAVHASGEAVLLANKMNGSRLTLRQINRFDFKLDRDANDGRGSLIDELITGWLSTFQVELIRDAAFITLEHVRLQPGVLDSFAFHVGHITFVVINPAAMRFQRV